MPPLSSLRAIPLILTVLGSAGAISQPALEIAGGKSFNFGTLLTNRVVTRELTLRNAGNDTLRLWDVSGSCGCTGTLLTRDHLLPGEEGVLKVTFDPAKFSGPVEKTVSMKTNDPRDPNPHIAFQAEINRILEFDREYIVFQTRPDSETIGEIHVRNNSDGPVTITGVESDSRDLTVTPSVSVIPPGEDAVLTCRLLTGRTGIMKGDFVLRTDHPVLGDVSLRYFSYSRKE